MRQRSSTLKQWLRWITAINYRSFAKKIWLSCLIVIVLSMSLVPPKPAQAFVFALPAAIPAGALAFWGGAALVATAGAAIGLDPDLMDEIAAFGESTYNKANAATKQAIDWATSAMTFNPTSEYEYQTYSVEFTPDVTTYLKAEFKDWFIDRSDRPVLSVNPTTNLLTYLDSVHQYTFVTANTDYILGMMIQSALPFNRTYNYIRRIGYYNPPGPGGANIAVVGTNTPTADLGFSRDHWFDLPDIKDATAAMQYFLQLGILVPTGGAIDPAPALTNPLPTNPDVIVLPDAIPVGWPDVITMPAPTGVLNPAGDMVTPAMPAFGYPNGVRTADPKDVAIGNPAIPGALPQTLTPDMAITAPAAIPVPANPAVPSPWTPTVPTGDWPDKLRAAVTTRFPFSIPWDAAYLINIFVAPPQVPVIAVDAGPIKFNVTLNQLDPYMPWFRTFLIVAFLWGLALNTRKLLGGGK